MPNSRLYCSVLLVNFLCKHVEKGNDKTCIGGCEYACNETLCTYALMWANWNIFSLLVGPASIGLPVGGRGLRYTHRYGRWRIKHRHSISNWGLDTATGMEGGGLETATGMEGGQLNTVPCAWGGG